MTEFKDRKRIAVAGASGFIGSQLIETLLPNYDVVGLTRYQKESTRHLTWRQCDLFSLLQAEHALRGADYAFYLVHSMMPTSHLTQASFEDMDLILADNFARAAAREGGDHADLHLTLFGPCAACRQCRDRGRHRRRSPRRGARPRRRWSACPRPSSARRRRRRG